MTYEERKRINNATRAHRAQVEKHEQQAALAWAIVQLLTFAAGFVLGAII